MNTIYSTPLHKKLGIKEGFKIKLINEPEHYSELLNGISSQISILVKLKEPIDFIHLFTRSKNELSVELPHLKNFINKNGMLWVSWPKKSSEYISDLNGDAVRKIGLMNGLVDTKICSIDENWSALKFVFRSKERK